MNKYDLEHKLLNGSVIYMNDDIPTYKVTMSDMDSIGFSTVQNIIDILCIDEARASEFIKNNNSQISSSYLLLVATVLSESDNPSQDSLYTKLLKFLSKFFRQEVLFDKDNLRFVFEKEKKVLDSDNYNEFQMILKARNCLIGIDNFEELENPSNEAVKKLLEKRRKLREKLNKAKTKDDNESLTMADLISIFAEAEHMPLQYVYENYDIYQFNNQFNRLKIMDDFHVNIQALLLGANKDDIGFQHWLSKIDNKND